VLRSGLQVDLRVIPTESFGAALHYFTGSKEHNVKIRALGVRKKLRVNEWGVYPASDATQKEDFGERLAGASEEEVFAVLGLAWIPPELREDRGEIEAARAGTLPGLIRREDLRGDLQMHSTWSDGRYPIEVMATSCRELGYEYFALTDHSQSLTMTNGLTPERVRMQWREIEEVRQRVPGIALLRSLEVDILKDGSLDMPDEILEQLDVVVASVHSFMQMGEAEMTERVIRALRHPMVDVLAHPTGRLLTRRAPYALDVEAVLQAAKDLNVAVELNASPNRLDLSDVHVHRAKELGVKVAISTDAHTVRELGYMRHGIEQARRGWLERKDVLNAMSLGELRVWLERRL
jgi:DNA polymerase (family 10)